MTSSSKRKGSGYELELARYLSENTGLSVGRTRTSIQFIHSPGIGNPDLIGTPDLAVEAKRTENLQLRPSLAQAIRNSKEHEIPVVISRRSREPTGESVCVLLLDDFIKLYNAYLAQNGLK